MAGLRGNSNSEYFLVTERLGFRCWTAEDLNLALDLWGDPQVTRLIDARGRLTRAQVHDRLLQEIATERRHGIQYWPIFLLNVDEHVGCCGLRPHGTDGGVIEIGFHICRRHWGRGFATEGAMAVLAYAFGTLGAKAVFAGHNPANAASRHLVLKLGLRYTHDEFYPPTGLSHPSYLLTAEEYLKTNR